MAARPFLASDLKIARAKKHLAELELMIQSYLDSNPIVFDTTIDVEDVGLTEEGRKIRRAHIVWNHKQEAMPEEVSAIIGDLIHNLRSALDLLATEICRAAEDPDDQTHFPFGRSQEGFEERLRDLKFDRAGEAAMKLVRELMPYAGGNLLLRAIHDLDIRDKHRRLIINQLNFASPLVDFGPPEKRYEVPKVVDDPTKPSAIRFLFPDDCSLAGQELVPSLQEMVHLTAGIIESFKLLRTPAG
jgi:hypothetical protein